MTFQLHQLSVDQRNSAVLMTVVLTCHCSAMTSTTAQTDPTSSIAVKLLPGI